VDDRRRAGRREVQVNLVEKDGMRWRNVIVGPPRSTSPRSSPSRASSQNWTPRRARPSRRSVLLDAGAEVDVTELQYDQDCLAVLVDLAVLQRHDPLAALQHFQQLYLVDEALDGAALMLRDVDRLQGVDARVGFSVAFGPPSWDLRTNRTSGTSMHRGK
jgi:hypothetical protein